MERCTEEWPKEEGVALRLLSGLVISLYSTSLSKHFFTLREWILVLAVKAALPRRKMPFPEAMAFNIL